MRKVTRHPRAAGHEDFRTTPFQKEVHAQEARHRVSGLPVPPYAGMFCIITQASCEGCGGRMSGLYFARQIFSPHGNHTTQLWMGIRGA